jgi:hypothetical protein
LQEERSGSMPLRTVTLDSARHVRPYHRQRLLDRRS